MKLMCLVVHRMEVAYFIYNSDIILTRKNALVCPAMTLTLCVLCCLKTASVFNKFQFCQARMNITGEKSEILPKVLAAKFKDVDFRVNSSSVGEWETL